MEQGFSIFDLDELRIQMLVEDFYQDDDLEDEDFADGLDDFEDDFDEAFEDEDFDDDDFEDDLEDDEDEF